MILALHVLMLFCIDLVPILQEFMESENKVLTIFTTKFFCLNFTAKIFPFLFLLRSRPGMFLLFLLVSHIEMALQRDTLAT